jgi:hypothetical protein
LSEKLFNSMTNISYKIKFGEKNASW